VHKVLGGVSENKTRVFLWRSDSSQSYLI